MKAATSFIFVVSFIIACSGFTSAGDDFLVQNAPAEPTKEPEVVETPPKATKTEDPLIFETPPPSAFEEVTEYVGCFKDQAGARSLPDYYADFRLSIDWTDMKKTVKQCADEAKSKGHKWFGVQFYGECWSGPDAGVTYDKYGASKNCWKGVGRHWTNAVYKFVMRLKKTGNVVS